MVAHVLGARCRPTTSFEQFWIWICVVLKEGKKFHMVCLSAICWAIWLTRNNFSFEGKIIISPTEIICLASSFISYCAGFQKGNDKEALEIGAETLKQTALYFHQQRQDSNCMMLPCWVRQSGGIGGRCWFCNLISALDSFLSGLSQVLLL